MPYWRTFPLEPVFNNNELRALASEWVDRNGKIRNRTVKPSEPLHGTIGTITDTFPENHPDKKFTGVFVRPIAEGSPPREMTFCVGDNEPKVGNPVMIIRIGDIDVGII